MDRVLAVSPLDGRYFEQVNQLSFIVSEFALIKYRLIVEIEWLKLLFAIEDFGLPKLSDEDINYLDNIVKNYDISVCNQIKTIEKTTNHDVKAIEYYLKDQFKNHQQLNKYKEFIHFACTSEDINNLSYALMIKDLKDKVLFIEINKICNKIENQAYLYKEVAMMSRTHGQPATPTTMGKEFYNIYYRLQRQLKQLNNNEILGKINGAVGNYNAHFVSFPNINWVEVSKRFVERLGLTFNPYTTQIEPHDYMAEIFDNLRRINIILLDFARDIWGYIAINYFRQRIKEGEVGSSTMPHKVNPIDFENCEGNLGLSNSILNHLSEKLPISRWQRDLSDSTVLRNIGVAISYSVLAYNSLLKGLDKLEINQDIINLDLDNNWELLAEPIQMIMRKAGIHNAYEKLKELTRGKKIDAVKIKEFVNSLDIPENDKKVLLNLTPHTYIGLAKELF
ncbi:MAG TPA: adenylosuccinate lyase [Burkholderiales bacterium]|nr:adenylosuccinate lyase [Burkholderiales bacterium]